jgi:hypothetical protein
VSKRKVKFGLAGDNASNASRVKVDLWVAQTIREEASKCELLKVFSFFGDTFFLPKAE